MKPLLFSVLLSFVSSASLAQKDSTAFHAYIYSQEYDVFLNIDLYKQDITVPGQELYGQLPGYLGKQNNTFCWVITTAKIKNDHVAELSLINDYGSEDLTVQLTQKNDSTYILRQLEGSSLKVPKNGRWQKLPKSFELKRMKR